MTNQEIINFLNQIRNILLDDKSWLESTIQSIGEAFDKTISALQAQDISNTNAGDMVSRKAVELALIEKGWSSKRYKIGEIWELNADEIKETLATVPPVRSEPSEITDEQAILHLQSTGWMQNHDKEMYEMGLREQLADDSRDYKSLIPCADTISRQDTIETIRKLPNAGIHWFVSAEEVFDALLKLPSAQPEQRWIPCNKKLPEAGVRYQVTFESGEVGYADFRNKIFLSDGSAKENVWETERYYEDDGEVIAWSPLPKPYEEENEK